MLSKGKGECMNLVELHKSSGEALAVNPQYVISVGVVKGIKERQTFDHAILYIQGYNYALDAQEDYQTAVKLLGSAVRVIGQDTIARIA